jgi:predicted MFS family arabinose efflux permease
VPALAPANPLVRLFGRVFRLVWGADVDPPLRPVLAVSFASSMGGSTVWSFVGIWAIERLHADQSAVGLAFLISALVGAGSGYVGGHLSDYIGRRPLILVSWAFQVALILGFLAAGDRELFGLGLLCLGGLTFQVGSAANQAMIADLVPPERHEQAFASVRVAQNLGITLGPPTGALLLALGSWPTLFVGASALFFGGFLLALRLLPSRGDYAPLEPPTRHSFTVIVRDRPFLLFLVSSGLAWLVYVSFEVVLPISLVGSHGFARYTWGFLVVVNPVMVTLFQLRLTQWLRPVPGALKLAIGLPLMGLPFLLLPIVDAVPAVALMIFVFVIGEMLWVPTSQAIVAGLAPEDIRGAYMGAFGSMSAIGFALAPFLGLQIRGSFGDTAFWVVVAAVSLVAASTGAAACRVAFGRRPRSASAPA